MEYCLCLLYFVIGLINSVAEKSKLHSQILALTFLCVVVSAALIPRLYDTMFKLGWVNRLEYYWEKVLVSTQLP